jgi:hypothetical protein
MCCRTIKVSAKILISFSDFVTGAAQVKSVGDRAWRKTTTMPTFDQWLRTKSRNKRHLPENPTQR